MAKFYFKESEIHETNQLLEGKKIPVGRFGKNADLVLLQSSEWLELQLDIGSLQARLSAPIAKLF